MAQYDRLFFQADWEKQSRRGMQKFRTTASGPGFQRSILCPCPQPFLAAVSCCALLCSQLLSLCRFLPAAQPLPHCLYIYIYIYVQLLSQFTIPIGIFLCPWCWFTFLKRGKLFGDRGERTITQHPEPLLLCSLDRIPSETVSSFYPGAP